MSGQISLPLVLSVIRRDFLHRESSYVAYYYLFEAFLKSRALHHELFGRSFDDWGLSGLVDWGKQEKGEIFGSSRWHYLYRRRQKSHIFCPGYTFYL